eukprot:5342693-Heterocapsa_arctica.AAC.1
MAKRDRLAINGETDCARHFAMPCSTDKPEDNDFDLNIEPTIKLTVRADKDLPLDLEPLRRKPRFDGNIFIEEVVVDSMLDHYKYVISRARKRPLRPVTRDASTMYTRDMISLAVARYRAIELAN